MRDKGSAPRDTLPENFSTLDELWEFWDTHSSADYEDTMEPVEAEIDVSSSKVSLSLQHSTGIRMSNFIVTIPRDEIAAFCQRWKIRELALFGSILRDDFSPDSDVDVLVTFGEHAEWGLFDHVQMQYELQALLQRSVDLISKRAVERSQNWLRRQEILDTAQVLFSMQEATYRPVVNNNDNDPGAPLGRPAM